MLPNLQCAGWATPWACLPAGMETRVGLLWEPLQGPFANRRADGWQMVPVFERGCAAGTDTGVLIRSRGPTESRTVN